MYGHFTFFNYYFKGTSQIIKVLVKKKKKNQNNVNEQVSNSEKKGEINYGRK